MPSEIDPKDLEPYVWRSFAILGFAGLLALWLAITLAS